MTPTRIVPSDTAELAAELRLVLGRISRHLSQSRSGDELTPSQSSVLGRLEREGPRTPGALATAERVRPQAMAATLSALEDRGLLIREAAADDRRCVVVSITDLGQATVASLRNEYAQLLARALTRDFSAAELRQLAETLPLLDRLSQLI